MRWKVSGDTARGRISGVLIFPESKSISAASEDANELPKTTHCSDG